MEVESNAQYLQDLSLSSLFIVSSFKRVMNLSILSEVMFWNILVMAEGVSCFCHGQLL